MWGLKNHSLLQALSGLSWTSRSGWCSVMDQGVFLAQVGCLLWNQVTFQYHFNFIESGPRPWNVTLLAQILLFLLLWSHQQKLLIPPLKQWWNVTLEVAPLISKLMQVQTLIAPLAWICSNLQKQQMLVMVWFQLQRPYQTQACQNRSQLQAMFVIKISWSIIIE